MYIECVEYGETKGLVKKQMIVDDFAFYLHVFIHLVQCLDNLRLVPKFQAPVHEMGSIKK
jgi:hypothetical protein